MTTIDHVSGGRAGVNIVCGWNKADFIMFGIPELPHDERYVQGQEWFDIWSRLLAGAPLVARMQVCAREPALQRAH